MDLGGALQDLIRAYCEQESIDWREEGQPFLKRLQREAMRNMDDPIEEMIQRMWTSPLTLRGHEFCFLLNRAIRGDLPALADPTATFAVLFFVAVLADAVVHSRQFPCRFTALRVIVIFGACLFARGLLPAFSSQVLS